VHEPSKFTSLLFNNLADNCIRYLSAVATIILVFSEFFHSQQEPIFRQMREIRANLPAPGSKNS
jgi:hypothetical protein